MPGNGLSPFSQTSTPQSGRAKYSMTSHWFRLATTLQHDAEPTIPARLVAELIELNVVTFFGIITKVDGGGERFEMFTNPNADPQSGYVKKSLTVTVDSDTLFSASAQEDLKAGRDVQMVGLGLRNGTVRATRVTVYEGNRPVRMGNGKVLPPTGLPPK